MKAFNKKESRTGGWWENLKEGKGGNLEASMDKGKYLNPTGIIYLF